MIIFKKFQSSFKAKFSTADDTFMFYQDKNIHKIKKVLSKAFSTLNGSLITSCWFIWEDET